MEQENQSQVSAFAKLGIIPEIDQILAQKNFTIPTLIQEKSIPIVTSGKDLIGLAQTGTGKTLAFALPIIQKLLSNKEQALVIVPTRELAWQVEKMFEEITRSLKSRLSTVTLIGGVPIQRQRLRLKKKPRVIIATPGRLEDHIRRRILRLDNCKTIVLDEADRMFDIGFAPQIKEFLAKAPEDKQTLLFSATMPAEIKELINTQLQSPLEVKVEKQKTGKSIIRQELCVLASADKAKMLEQILRKTKGQTIIFTKTKIGTTKLAKKIYQMGFESTELHSDRSMSQRKRALDGFRQGKYQILVATDIAARGIDISDIELVINYDLPQAAEDYVHRIGRTGRAGKSGRAITFAAQSDAKKIRKIENLMAIKFEMSESSLPLDRNPNSSNRRSRSNRRKRFGNNSNPRRGGGNFSGRRRKKSSSTQKNGTKSRNRSFKRS